MVRRLRGFPLCSLALATIGLSVALGCASSPRPGLDPSLAARPAASGTPQGVTAFVNVAVVPMDTDRLLRGQTVVIDGGRIAALGPSGQIRIPPSAIRVDGRGKVLIPGLGDMHAHLHEYYLGMGVVDSQTLETGLQQRLFLWLAHGLTTVRNLDYSGHNYVGNNGFRGEWLLRLRSRAATGEILSPRIFTSWALRARLPGPDTGARSPSIERLDEVVEAVTTYKAAGFDFIKVGATGATPAQGPIFDSLVSVARRAGLPIVGHAQGLERALQTHRSIEHMTGYIMNGFESSKDLDAIMARIPELAAATQRAGVWNCPTLYNFIRNDMETSSQEEENQLKQAKYLAIQQQLIKALQQAGAGLLAGSDRLMLPRSSQEAREAGLTPAQRQLDFVYGYAGATHRELQALVEAGLTPYQALATATRNVAVYFGTLDSTGTIAVGKRADLVLLAGNPLADIRQTERIAGVMIGGRWLDRAELDRRTADIGAWLKQRCLDPAVTEKTFCNLP